MSVSRLVAAVSASLMLIGCATSGTLAEPETKNKIYSGTIRHFELKCAHAVCLDFPFSLVADTLLLPITIPWTIVNFVWEDPDEEGNENAQSKDH